MALSRFEQNLGRASEMIDLEQSVGRITTSAVDLSDLLRSALVAGVSALDFFVHEYVREGMLNIYTGSRPPTDAYNAFVVPMSAVNIAISSPGNTVWFDEVVREAHGWKSFQHPDKIKAAVRLISTKELWHEVSDELSSDVPTVKSELVAIVDRRNKIAHEADMDPTYPGTLWPINEPLVRHALAFLGAIARAIDSRI